MIKLLKLKMNDTIPQGLLVVFEVCHNNVYLGHIWSQWACNFIQVKAESNDIWDLSMTQYIDVSWFRIIMKYTEYAANYAWCSTFVTFCCVQVHRDQSRYAPNRWETSIQCNNVSHWLGAYLDWSRWSDPFTRLLMVHWHWSSLERSPLPVK